MTPTAQEVLDKLRWHLTWVNTLTAHLTELGVKTEVRTFYTGTGRALLLLKGDGCPN